MVNYEYLTKEQLINELKEKDKYIYDLKKANEEAKNYAELKTELFSIISHELKTPLNIIFGAIQLIENIHKEQENCKYCRPLNKYLKTMRQNCYRLLRLINNFIDMNKIEIGFFKLNLTNNDIVKTIEDITLSVVEFAQAKQINIIFDTEIEEKIIATDSEKIERVILNLLSNSIKFTDSGGIIEVYIKNLEESIVIAVKDNGSGMPEEMLEKIFDIFSQVDSSLRRQAEGSGIGLFLSKSIIEMHGGKIYAKSKLGIGSEFIIEIPTRIIEDSKVAEVAISAERRIEKIHIEFADIYS
ncbi:signal transduction histidine kinase [Clostridium punense]|uniref:histidine kinase n=1 Tax=Clostridium punense TaxID=1054297 RepID=A0ABS4KAS6_9CLOT|nr:MULTISPECIES: HAMP domain-containing sensor histidine kinase [Clostridium]EQB86345.1 hypothetical protein M918_14740 [Clostridium sp. BL8]MBP2023719.1 signal transduction histidine kinase [Clostridium punense]